MKQLAILLAVMVSVVSGAAQTPPPAMLSAMPERGVEPLTATTRADAMRSGAETGGPYPLLSLFTVRARRLNDVDRLPTRTERADLAAVIARGPFDITLVTPYVRVFVAAADARRRFAFYSPRAIDEENQDQVWIVVGPGPNFATAEAVEDLVILLDGKVIRPMRREIRPRQISNALGASRSLAEGRFQFPFEVFSGSSPIQITVVGSHQNFEWTVEVEELKRLR